MNEKKKCIEDEKKRLIKHLFFNILFIKTFSFNLNILTIKSERSEIYLFDKRFF